MATTCTPDPIAVLDRPEPPFSVSQGTLYPILVQNTTRYDVLKTVTRTPCIIKSGMFQSSRNPSPTYMPPQWSAFIHPEGKEYFYRNSGLPVVTEAHMFDPETADKVCAWATEVERQAVNQGFVLDGNIDLFLEIDDNDCSYYLVDRATSSIFWLTEYTTTELGLNSVVSKSQLKLLLESQYWSHVEKFCMHFGGLPQKAIDDLILVFLHALADNLTSNRSTFPYTASQCEKFLELLNSSRDYIHCGHVVAYVGHIWSYIFYNRYETHYGLELNDNEAGRSLDNTVTQKGEVRSMIHGKKIIVHGGNLTNVAGDYHEHHNTYITGESVTSQWKDLFKKLVSEVMCSSKEENEDSKEPMHRSPSHSMSLQVGIWENLDEEKLDTNPINQNEIHFNSLNDPQTTFDCDDEYYIYQTPTAKPDPAENQQPYPFGFWVPGIVHYVPCWFLSWAGWIASWTTWVSPPSWVWHSFP